MLKSLGWVAVGLVVGALIHAWLAPPTDPLELRDDAPGAVAPETIGASEYGTLKKRIAQLNESGTARATEYEDLAERTAALEERVRILSETLEALRAQQSGGAETADPGSPAVETTGPPGDASGSPYGKLQLAPASLREIEAELGSVLIFRVVGSTRGSVWGTDVYTDDSSIAAAAVHSGLLQPDEIGAIMVTVLPGRDAYVGSSRYGVRSNDYVEWPRSFRLLRIY